MLRGGERNPLFAALSQQQARALVEIRTLHISLCGLRIYERRRSGDSRPFVLTGGPAGFATSEQGPRVRPFRGGLSVREESPCFLITMGSDIAPSVLRGSEQTGFDETRYQ